MPNLLPRPAWIVAGMFAVLAAGLGLAGCGGGGGGGAAAPGAPAAGNPTPAPSQPAVAFRGDVVLGSPTADSVKVNVYAADQSGTVWVTYGSSPEVMMRQTARAALQAGEPVEFTLTGLTPGLRHHYSLNFQADANTVADVRAPQSFQTARPAGTPFVFALQGDSHPERLNQQFNPDLYTRTLDTAAADRPDFYILMGDDFSVDQIDPSRISQALVKERYTLQRPWLTRIGRSAPLFLVNGNHEQAARYLLDGTPDNIAVWAQNARNSLYAQPGPDNFYSGNPEVVPHIGLLRNYYAWTWGDALFVVIDPYWSSPVPVDGAYGAGKLAGSQWDITHGEAQFQWLKRTLESSQARYKFVFAHHVMGTGRGGIELASRWEWGGLNARGVNEFAAQRPGWVQPIHALMAANRVTIFFQGHDHVWVRQQLDGVTYQTLSQPADPNYALNYADAYLSGEKHPSSGYTRVSVDPSGGVKVEYVLSVLPQHETATRRHGAVATSYTLR